tara:strand:+ start:187 stop:1308 length:1122 start_codon:yes stop_codon:yes gene_type:complete
MSKDPKESLCTQITNSWASLGKSMYSPFHWLPPLADLTAFTIILVQCLWTFIVYYYEIWGVQEKLDSRGAIEQEATTVGFDTAFMVGTLSAALTFLLSMTLSAALGKNAACLNNYNAFTGDVMAYGWDVVAFTKAKIGKNTKEEITNIFHILMALPLICKHSFRGHVDLKRVKTFNLQGMQYKEIQFITTKAGKEIQKILALSTENGERTGMNVVEACFYQLLDYQHELTDGRSTPVSASATKSWERAYGSYGNMGNLNAYKPPILFTYVLNLTLYLYILLLPFTLKSEQLNAVWMTGLIAYFFIGLNVAGSKVGNAFASNKAGSYQTVTPAQKQATITMKHVFKTVDLIQTPNDINIKVDVDEPSYITPFKF